MKSADIRWTNANGTGIWSDASNWSTGLPGNGDIAIFDATSLSNCIIDINIDVSGIRIDAAYTGTITQNIGNTIAIGSDDYVQNNGRFQGGNASIDFNNGTFTLAGGDFISTSGTMFWDQSILISGGNFHHNNGTIVFNANANRTINLPSIDTLFNLEISPTVNNRQFSINSADTLYIENKLTLTNGRVQSGILYIKDSLVFNSAYDDGSADIYFVGSGNSHLVNNDEVGTHDFFVNKSSTTDSLKVSNSLAADIVWGNDEDLTLNSGTIIFTESVNLDFSDITLNGGVWVASSKNTYLFGNWTNNGAMFKANGGTWVFDHVDNRNYQTHQNDTFNILVCNASSNKKRINIASGDTIEVLQRLTLTEGMIKSGIIKVHDSLEINSNYDSESGQSDVIFVGNKTSLFVVNSYRGEHNFFVNKSTSSDTVKFFDPSSSSLVLGDIDRDFAILRGVADFSLATNLDFNFQSLRIESGAEVIAAPGVTNFSASWNNNGGNFKANGGTWIWDHNDNINYTSHQNDTFNILQCKAASNKKRINLTAQDSIVVLQKLLLSEGQFKNGSILIYDTLEVESNYDNESGQSDVYFIGGQTSNYLVTSNQGNFDVFIRKDQSTDTVYFDQKNSSSLVVGDDQRDLDIMEGVVAFSKDNSANVNYNSLIIRNGGEVLANPNELRYQGNWNNEGGKFNANNGKWIWDHTGNMSYTSFAVDTFNVLEMNASSNNKRLTITSGDTIAVRQKLTLSNGQFLNGSILIFDTLDLASSNYDNSTNQSDLYMRGSTEGEIIANFSGRRHPIIIDKSNGTNVNVYDSDGGSLTLGNTTNTLLIKNGNLQFRDNPYVNLSFSTLNLESGGSLTGSSNTLDFDGNWNNQGGRFIHNEGIFYFNATNHRSYVTTVVDTFYTFNYDADGGARILTMATDDTIRVLHDLILTDGRIRNGILSVQGNVDVESGYDTDNASASLQFIGPDPQTFDLTGANSRFDGDIILDKSKAEEVTLLSTFDMDLNGQSIFFNKGYIKSTDANVIFVDGNNFPMIGMNDSSFVRGPVEKRNNGNFTFPIGDSIYAPLTITNVSGTGTQFRAKYFDRNPKVDGYIPDSLNVALENVSVVEYWDLERTNTSNSCKVNLSWRPSSGVEVPADIVVAHWNNGTNEWESIGATASSGDKDNGSVASSVTSSFSPFTLGSTSENNPLPVVYGFFEGRVLTASNLLSWQTTSEVNADYFTVQRSTDAEVWEDIGMIEANGNSSTIQNYAFSDQEVDSNIYYYRLKQVDFDGQYEYSKIVVLNRKGISTQKTFKISVFPNPLIAGESLTLENVSLGDLIQLYSLDGRLVMEKLAQEDRVIISNLNSGSYVLRVTGSKGISHKKILVLE